jgi:hypothetical protein
MALYPRTDVRGRSLIGAQLASAHLSGSDVRGTDFTSADLHDADLSNNRAGMSRGWSTLLFLCSLVLSIALGVLIAVCVRYMTELYTAGDIRQRMAALFVTSSLLVYLVAGIWRGLRYATYNVLPVTLALAVAAGVSAAISGTGTGIIAALTLVFVVVAAAIVVFAVVVRAVAGTVGTLFFMVVAISGAIVAGLAGGGLLGTAIAIGAMLMARRSVKLEQQYPALARLTAAIACRGGTRFRDADLRGANLDHARLSACDLRGADLTGAHLDHATMHLCRVDSASPTSRTQG